MADEITRGEILKNLLRAQQGEPVLGATVSGTESAMKASPRAILSTGGGVLRRLPGVELLEQGQARGQELMRTPVELQASHPINAGGVRNYVASPSLVSSIRGVSPALSLSPTNISGAPARTQVQQTPIQTADNVEDFLARREAFAREGGLSMRFNAPKEGEQQVARIQDTPASATIITSRPQTTTTADVARDLVTGFTPRPAVEPTIERLPTYAEEFQRNVTALPEAFGRSGLAAIAGLGAASRGARENLKSIQDRANFESSARRALAETGIARRGLDIREAMAPAEIQKTQAEAQLEQAKVDALMSGDWGRYSQLTGRKTDLPSEVKFKITPPGAMVFNPATNAMEPQAGGVQLEGVDIPAKNPAEIDKAVIAFNAVYNANIGKIDPLTARRRAAEAAFAAVQQTQ